MTVANDGDRLLTTTCVWVHHRQTRSDSKMDFTERARGLCKESELCVDTVKKCDKMNVTANMWRAG